MPMLILGRGNLHVGKLLQVSVAAAGGHLARSQKDLLNAESVYTAAVMVWFKAWTYVNCRGCDRTGVRNGCPI